MKVKELQALRESAKKGIAVPTEVRLYINGGIPFQVVARTKPLTKENQAAVRTPSVIPR